MPGVLLEIKKRIEGVQNTRKITKAMQLVAASKMRQFQKRAISARSFAWDLFKILENNLSEEDSGIYTEKRPEGKTLFVLYTSDKGLCGALNNKLINALFRSNKWKNLKEDERLLMTIGKKSYSYARSNKIPVAENFIAIPEKFTNLDVISVVDKIIQYWQTERSRSSEPKALPASGVGEPNMSEANNLKVKEVIFVAPHYKNSFTFYPVIKTFLPFSEKAIRTNLHVTETEAEELKQGQEEKEDQNMSMIFLPEEEHVIMRLHEQILSAMFIQSFLELKASEYSSRMIAMQNATDSADKITNNLKLTYNKARQQAITQEIAELIGASIAIEGA